MGQALTTTTTVMLEALKDPSQGAVWAEFDARYRPVVAAFARRLGLGDAEAEDVAQETLIEFLRAYRKGKYDRSRGRLGSWIMGIARHRIADGRIKAARSRGQRGESAFSVVADLRNRTRMTAVWDQEQKRAIVQRAMEILRQGRTSDNSLKAFELLAIRGVPAAAAAEQCGMTPDEVYVAKNRVGKRLREIVDELKAAWREEG